MLEFKISDQDNIGRAEVEEIVMLNGNRVDRTPGRNADVYFLVKITFSTRFNKWLNDNENLVDQVPTGNIRMPYVLSASEYIVTDNNEVWEAVRHLDHNQLLATNQEQDEHLYIVHDAHMPDRLCELTTSDRTRIADAIDKFVTNFSQSM